MKKSRRIELDGRIYNVVEITDELYSLWVGNFRDKPFPNVQGFELQTEDYLRIGQKGTDSALNLTETIEISGGFYSGKDAIRKIVRYTIYLDEASPNREKALISQLERIYRGEVPYDAR